MNQNKKNMVELVFRRMLVQGSTTTLDVKKQLRNDFPKYKWNQDNVSEALMEIESNDSNLTFTDNGVYREYTVVGYNSNGPIKVSKTTSNTTVSRGIRDGGKISKTDAVTKIKSSKGRFFTVTFIKKDKSERTLNGNVRLDNFMNNQGYINVRESNGNIRQINPRTITALTIAGSQYNVK